MSDPLLIAAAVIPALIVVCFAVVVILRVLWIQTQSGREARCVKCGSRDVRPSWTIGLMDRVYMLFSCVPYRCRSCRSRFYRRETFRTDTA